jgi:hypothetical protein
VAQRASEEDLISFSIFLPAIRRHAQFPGRLQNDRGARKFEGDRLDISFDGLQLGIFHGNIHFIFFPGSTLISQRAILSTNEPDTAFYYDAGIRMTADEDRRSVGTMETNVNYYDTTGKLQPCALLMLRSGIRWPPGTARFPPRPGTAAWPSSHRRTGISWLAITPVTWDIFGTRPGAATCR